MAVMAIPELVHLIVAHVASPADLLNCACINSTWNIAALQKLYEGSINDMRYRTPDIGSLNSLFAASRERFAQNMGFTKHLLIASDAPTFHKDSTLDEYFYQPDLTSMEKCRPLLKETSTKLMIQPRGRGPTSVAIPFRLINQRLSHELFGQILHPNLKSLTINAFYCQSIRIENCLPQDPSATIKFSNLSSLSILKSRRGPNIMALTNVLKECDLRLFQISGGPSTNRLSTNDTVQLLRSLWEQRNLQALALMSSRGKCMGKLCAELESRKRALCWPELKALRLGNATSKDWLARIPAFENLQILQLHNFTSSYVELAINSISKCHNLRVLDIRLLDAVLKSCTRIARSCPLLKRFCVRTGLGGYEQRAGDDFTDLIQALPNVELLSLGISYLSITSWNLRELASSCPNLEMLELHSTDLLVTAESLSIIPPLPTLTMLLLKEIKLGADLSLGELQEVAKEWERVFPRLRYVPCNIDRLEHRKELQGPYDELEELDSVDAVTVFLGSLDDDSEYNSKFPVNRCAESRRYLWYLLKYEYDASRTSLGIVDGINHIWQTKFEIELFGYPMVPMEAYVDPSKYSSADLR